MHVVVEKGFRELIGGVEDEYEVVVESYNIAIVVRIVGEELAESFHDPFGMEFGNRARSCFRHGVQL